MADARFEDGGEKPLRLRAEGVEDLSVLSALLQDAVAQSSDASWMPGKHRFALLLNRFRWEDAETATAAGRPFERVQSMLVIESALKVAASGVDPLDRSLVLSILALEFTSSDEGAGVLRLIIAGDGAIALDVECLDVTLTDVSRPYLARAGQIPTHSPD